MIGFSELKNRLLRLLVLMSGLTAAGFIVYNSCDAQGADVWSFFPALWAAIALIMAIIDQIKRLF